jgi:Fis family transcriptional regulator
VKITLNQSVQESVEDYLRLMDDESVTGLYDLVMTEVEAPLLRSVLAYTNNNQSQTAAILGINRGTLRKKIRQYRLL